MTNRTKKQLYADMLALLDRVHGLLDSEVSSEFIHNDLFDEMGCLIEEAREANAEV